MICDCGAVSIHPFDTGAEDVCKGCDGCCNGGACPKGVDWPGSSCTGDAHCIGEGRYVMWSISGSVPLTAGGTGVLLLTGV